MKKPRAIGVEPEKIDILASEINENLPYWLNPVVEYSNSPRVRAARQKKYQEHWAKRKKTSE